MKDFVLRTGDKAIFDASFPPATVTAQPGVITGSGLATIDDATVCVEGDEATVVVTGATYLLPGYSPGVGIVTITGLAADQMAAKGTSNGRALLLRGSRFEAQLQVVTPGIQTSPAAAPDPTPMYSGGGKFETANAVTEAE